MCWKYKRKNPNVQRRPSEGRVCVLIESTMEHEVIIIIINMIV